MTKQANELTIAEAAKALRAKEFTVRELWNACHAASAADSLNAFREVFSPDDDAIAAAQKRIDEGDVSLLCGMPIAMKDNILIQGHIASASSKILGNYVATYDATVTKRLKEAGALFIGRTNMDEFALGGSTENSAYGYTKNPHDPSRVAGGTSGGSAAAVAAHMCIAALGTDTGGSVRNPASYCGVVGMKPTYGAVSRSGLIAAASSFDQAGPITKTVEDARIIFDVIQGKDPLDSTSVVLEPKEVPVRTIGVFDSSLGGLDKEVAELFDSAMKKLSSGGVDKKTTTIPSQAPALAAYYIINFAEVSANLARFDGVRYGDAKRGATLLDDYVDTRTEGFGAETKRRILLGTYVLSAGYIDAYYRKAEAARRQLASEYDAAFMDCDVIATPTMPTPAFKAGEKSDPLSLYLEDMFTVTANLTGMPAISVPMGTMKSADGHDLPVGIQFTGPKGSEERLFAIAAKLRGEAL